MKTSWSVCPQQAVIPMPRHVPPPPELWTFPQAWDQDPGLPGATGWQEKRRAAVVQDVVVPFPLGQSLRKR